MSDDKPTTIDSLMAGYDSRPETEKTDDRDQPTKGSVSTVDDDFKDLDGREIERDDSGGEYHPIKEFKYSIPKEDFEKIRDRVEGMMRKTAAGSALLPATGRLIDQEEGGEIDSRSPALEDREIEAIRSQIVDGCPGDWEEQSSGDPYRPPAFCLLVGYSEAYIDVVDAGESPDCWALFYPDSHAGGNIDLGEFDSPFAAAKALRPYIDEACRFADRIEEIEDED